MLTNSKEILLMAKEKGFAVPATNFIDLDSARTFVNTAEERGLPLMLPFAQSHRSIISLEEASAIGKLLAEKATVPIVLHLDHGEDLDFIKRAIDLGFTSVMIDASEETFENNIEITRKVVEYAHQHNVTVEAELGHVGANDTTESDTLTASVHTEVPDVLEFVDKTNVDSLAVSIGTAHGVYVGTPELNFERLQEISQVVDIPLVLHGGSSTGDDNLTRCATNGISKINIFTDFLNGAMNEIKEADPNNYLELKQAANKGMHNILHHYYDVFRTEPINV